MTTLTAARWFAAEYLGSARPLCFFLYIWEWGLFTQQDSLQMSSPAVVLHMRRLSLTLMARFEPIYESMLLEGLAGNIGKGDFTFRETVGSIFLSLLTRQCTVSINQCCQIKSII